MFLLVKFLQKFSLMYPGELHIVLVPDEEACIQKRFEIKNADIG